MVLIALQQTRYSSYFEQKINSSCSFITELQVEKKIKVLARPMPDLTLTQFKKVQQFFAKHLRLVCRINKLYCFPFALLYIVVSEHVPY